MRRKIKKTRFCQDGSILVLVAVALVVLSILGLGMLQIAYGVRHKAIRLKNEATAMLAAEAGYEQAIYWMSQQKDLLSALQKQLDGTSGAILLPGGSCDYEIGLHTFIKARPVYRVTSVGHSGVFNKTVDVYVIQAIPGWAMGMCRVASGSTSSYPVNFANGEIIDMPIHINKLSSTIDPTDLRDIYITGSPRFLERVAMGESKYRDNGSDKPGDGDYRDYDDLMYLFEDGIYFKQPDCRINDEEAIDSKLERFEESTDAQFIFTPQATATTLTTYSNSYASTYKLPAVQLEFFVDNDGTGKVRITDNCTVLGYKRTNGNTTWDYRITPGTNATQFQTYPTYAYHVAATNADSTGDRITVPIENTYVTQSFGGVESAPGGQIFVEGNVVIGGHSGLHNGDQVVKGTIAVVATGNIWIADSLRVDGAHDADGKPTMENPNAIGLVAKGVVKVIDPGISGYPAGGINGYPGPVPNKYIPGTAEYGGAYDYAPVAHPVSGGETYKRYLSNKMIVEAAVTVGGGGWGAENVGRYYGTYYGGRKEEGETSEGWYRQDNLILRGAITESMRGVVGLVGTDGYLKHYYLDRRLLEGILPGDIWLQGKYVATPSGWHDYRY